MKKVVTNLGLPINLQRKEGKEKAVLNNCKCKRVKGIILNSKEPIHLDLIYEENHE